ncbi:glucan 1,4-alpha-maltotetraohydrolase domain-containing protein [Vitiosangium sp. GDMCC 1.1324]|uniref:glucan 1,4-alpha-maltotetraohydrolase domain-containing protein n=1 Tax=Vitiosangium sp. (strain GDMCC 1.1324) TaxID=2138576 RepID=UPI000D38A65A|nr:glucan 1,4-alpha-maltotetraohydrolase domain-containing protein [Vitiosangium sp. GDMCC 1.1324]PTL82864.1 alpha-amylase [Vitiosangium sp. GDMCC 1.1324]
MNHSKWMSYAALALACLVPAREAAAATQQTQASTAILVQGFHWNSASYSNPNWYNVLQGKASDLGAMGFTHVWLPPPSDAASTQGYLPRQLNVLNSSYGSETDLKNAITAFSNAGIKSVADVVINHRVGSTGWYDFTNPSWGTSSIAAGDECNCSTGAADSGDGYSAARDLDHSNSVVQTDLKNWLSSRLKGVGFSGIRFDYSKGYAPSYAKLYQDAMQPDFCVGEIWTNLDYNNVDAHRQQLMNWIDGTQGTCGAFDFTTKGLLNQALANNEYGRLKDSAGKPAGAIGWWAQKSVTFVDNHDTGPSESCGNGQNHWPVPCDKVMQGYAYVLTHPGIPSVYYPHIYDWGLKAQIKALMDVRKAQGITSTSTVAIQVAETGLYAAIINGNTAVKIGPNSWSPGTGWTQAASGSNYAVWTSGTGGGGGTCTTVPVTFSISNANTTFGQDLYVVGNQSQLGNWTPANGFKLTIQGSGANVTWSGTVQLSPSTAIQYKFVKYNGSTAVWESNASTSSGNREATTAACGSSTTLDGGNFKF